MTTVSKWSGVGISVQSALATALPISAITKANPGVLSYTGTDPTNGDYVKLSDVVGMSEVNNRVFRAANVVGASNTLELESENTSSYGTFSSGNAEVITFGTTLSIVRSLSASGGDFDFVDTTTIHDTFKKQIPGTSNAATYTFECLWDPADTGLAALRAASILQAQRAIKFTFPSGYKVVFLGYIGASGIPVGQTQEVVTTQVVITLFGAPTYYTT